MIDSAGAAPRPLAGSDALSPLESEPAASDAELMAAAKAGDRDAFGLVVERYKDRVVAYLARLSGSAERAQDLAQETFVRLFAALPRYREQGHLAALLYRIAGNLLRSEERKTRRLSFFELDPERHAARRPTASQESRALREEATSVVSEAIAALPLHYRVPLVLHEIEGWTVPRIAEATKTREGTVKSRISRAKQRLRASLESYWSGGVS